MYEPEEAAQHGARRSYWGTGTTEAGKIPKMKHAAAITVQVLRVIGVRGVPRSGILK